MRTYVCLCKLYKHIGDVLYNKAVLITDLCYGASDFSREAICIIADKVNLKIAYSRQSHSSGLLIASLRSLNGAPQEILNIE